MSLIRRNENYPAWSNFLNDFFDRDWLDWNNGYFSSTNTLHSLTVAAMSSDGHRS